MNSGARSWGGELWRKCVTTVAKMSADARLTHNGERQNVGGRATRSSNVRTCTALHKAVTGCGMAEELWCEALFTVATASMAQFEVQVECTAQVSVANAVKPSFTVISCNYG